MAKTVKKLTRPQMVSLPSVAKQLNRRVAAYARVSTGSEQQQSSIEAQQDYYIKLIDFRLDWTFAGLYIDATDIIGLKQNPTNGRRFSPIFHLSGIFRYKTRKCYF